jgi:lipopolysaccharide/colanic/teichoic acid biosynthesis glycosyltransferase
MRIRPILLDARPGYLADCSPTLSLLQLPLGADTVGGCLVARLRSLTQLPLSVIADDLLSAESACRMLAPRWPTSARAYAPDEFAAFIAGCEMSDAILLVAPRRLPVELDDLSRLIERYRQDLRSTHHLIGYQTGVGGTCERISFDGERIRAIHRHYELATWPVIGGVSATIFPAASGVVRGPLVPRSLEQLRGVLAAGGTPSRDHVLSSGAFHLDEEPGLLAANERFVVVAATGRSRLPVASPLLVGGGQTIDPGARIIGPVVVHGNVRIDAGATIVGPTVLGPGTSIGQGAVVAQSVVAQDCSIAPDAIVRTRVWCTSGVHASCTPVAVTVTSPASGTALQRRSRAAAPRERRAGPGYVAVKRAIDVVVAALALLVLAPVLVVVALLICAQRDGPVFYGDEREGFAGRVFRCWKFRTMASEASSVQPALAAIDQVDGPHFKAARDPRVTRLGSLLRASNLDELPQLFNVLIGEMSLVGPRPSPFRENQVCVPWREARISVRPGITGLWQLCRHDREAGDFHQWIEYDLLYVRHMNLLVDVRIILGTVLTLGGKITHLAPAWLIGRGAARQHGLAV